jgi:hypothetical protein
MIPARVTAGLALAAALVTGCTAAANPSPAPGPTRATHGTPTSSGAPTSSGSPTPLDTAALDKLDQQAARDDGATGGSSAGATKRRDWIVGSAGTYLVGRGISPGTYRSAGSPTGQCTWARLTMAKSATRVVDHGTATGAVTVRIRASDKFFETRDCANWHRTG